MLDLILSSAAVQVVLLWLYHRRKAWGFSAAESSGEVGARPAAVVGDELETIKAGLRGQIPAYDGREAFERWLVATSTRARFIEHSLQGLEVLMGVERELVELTLQGMTPKEIAQFKGVSGFHIYNVRSRVRKKLGVPDDVDLGDYLRVGSSINKSIVYLSPPLPPPKRLSTMQGVLAMALIELPVPVRVLCVAVLLGGAIDILYTRRNARAAVGGAETVRSAEVPKGCEGEVRMIRSLFEKLAAGKAVRVSDRDEALIALERIQHRLVGIGREEVMRQQQGLELTKSEREVLKLMQEGYSPQRIATILGCSLSRVYKARSGLRKKLEIPEDKSLGDYVRSMPD